jgi:hypothetical protein
MDATEQIAKKVEWLRGLRSVLELGQRLEEEHGLQFTDDERDMLKTLRERLPTIEAQFAKARR